jgi:hypothetical protein
MTILRFCKTGPSKFFERRHTACRRFAPRGPLKSYTVVRGNKSECPYRSCLRDAAGSGNLFFHDFAFATPSSAIWSHQMSSEQWLSRWSRHGKGAFRPAISPCCVVSHVLVARDCTHDRIAIVPVTSSFPAILNIHILQTGLASIPSGSPAVVINSPG